MPYTQEQLDTTKQMIFDLLEATERKEPDARNSIAALKTVQEDMVGEAAELNEYLE